MFPNVIAEARSSVWLIRPDKLRDIMAFLEAREAGVRAEAATLAAFAADNRRRAESRTQAGAIGVIPVLGSIVQRGNMFTEASGTASTDMVRRQFGDMMASREVSTIVLDIDSPGGTVYGIPELAAAIQAARGPKPIIAHANAEAASAAYWLATAADEIVVTPSGAVGSIGAYAMHVDQSGLNATVGVKPTYVSYGKYKTEGNPDEPLGDEALAEIQARVDKYGRQFEEAVAANRNVPLSKVRAEFGQGRMVDADTAKAVGMVDKVEAFDQTIARLLSTRPKIRRRLAHAENMLTTY